MIVHKAPELHPAVCPQCGGSIGLPGKYGPKSCPYNGDCLNKNRRLGR
jgi:hypothetical protein